MSIRQFLGNKLVQHVHWQISTSSNVVFRQGSILWKNQINPKTKKVGSEGSYWEFIVFFYRRFGAKDAKAKHAVKEKQYELLLDDEIEFIQVIFIATNDVMNHKISNKNLAKSLTINLLYSGF